MEFFSWTMLGTCAGATLAVAVLTEITKGIPLIKKIPTQIWSYILGLIVLSLAMFFTDGFSWSGIALTLFNAAIVSLASNGGYEAVERLKVKNKTE